MHYYTSMPAHPLRETHFIERIYNGNMFILYLCMHLCMYMPLCIHVLRKLTHPAESMDRGRPAAERLAL